MFGWDDIDADSISLKKPIKNLDLSSRYHLVFDPFLQISPRYGNSLEQRVDRNDEIQDWQCYRKDMWKIWKNTSFFHGS